MKERVNFPTWRTTKSERRFRAMEDQVWAEFPRPVEAHDVQTTRGVTRVYHWPGAGDPIVFIHGVGGTSVIWCLYAEALEGQDVWAIDILGDCGRSIQRLPYTTANDIGESLAEALEGVGISRCVLVGHSLGGWLALSVAVRHRSRIRSVVLLDPLGIGDLHMLGFLLWGLPVLFGALAPASLRAWIATRFRMPLLMHGTGIRMALYGQVNHPPRLRLPVFDDDELRSIGVPVTVLVGAKTEPFDVDEVVRRAQLIPGAHVEQVPDAGHAFPLDHVELVVDRIARTREWAPITSS